MTRPEDRPDIEQAKREAAQSKLRSQREYASSQERAATIRTFARGLRQMREDNGFAQLLDEAFGGGRA